jgi:hypothetical protein
MAQSSASTVTEYLASLPEDRRAALKTVRSVIKKNLPAGYKEMMLWGVISYVIPLTRYPDTYNGQPLSIVSLASQKNYMAVYLQCVYAHEPTAEWFRQAYLKAGKKLNMGKSCVRFKKLDDLPLDVIGQAVARVSVERFIEFYEQSRKK